MFITDTFYTCKPKNNIPSVENELPSATLLGIGDLLTRLHANAGTEKYADEFWVTLKNH